MPPDADSSLDELTRKNPFSQTTSATNANNTNDSADPARKPRPTVETSLEAVAPVSGASVVPTQHLSAGERSKEKDAAIQIGASELRAENSNSTDDEMARDEGFADIVTGPTRIIRQKVSNLS